MFRNSCIYNYNVHSLSKKSKISRTAIRRNIAIFMERKWCKMHHGNLIFRHLGDILFEEGIFNNSGDLCTRNTFVVVEISDKNKNHLSKLFYLELFKNKLRQIKMVAGKACDLIDPKGKDALDSHRKALKYFRGTNRSDIFLLNENTISLSLRKISKLFHCSISKAQKLIQFFIDNKLIKAFKEKMKYLGKANVFVDNLPTDYFFHKGLIFQQPVQRYAVQSNLGIISSLKKTVKK